MTYHVSSLAVHAAADQLQNVKAAIEQMEGAEVPGVNEVGKLVVVIEGDSRTHLADMFEEIKQIPGVLAATLVFHQMDEQVELD
ncbi:chaperone NapD [Vibrio sp. SCSIO 43136]|uniref:chaperone NapD n=1 Tax=Vibrio sp. SCSIO 43136 TaxID=2819101 RepID=UPI0020759A27|nr:chaperone NapD [Vibrio sp. SCSIO 43136]USD68014.1 chaperone NapD [Vibrio sp. SCSIO 43136]